MRNTLKLISSPRNLFVFEAAARLGSFTLAADELGMQQPSVSASIKQLEGSLSVRLFDRGHRQITLTNAGLRFYCLLYTSPSPRDATLSRMPSSA